MSCRKIVDSEIQNFQIELADPQKQALATYCDELIRWNKKFNLTALSGARLVRRLVAEPVWIGRHLPLVGSLVDIGSGNGSPAVPFHIACSLTACHLIEARAKRAAFLRHLIVTLKLTNVTVHRGRFENIAGSLEQPDWISLQAVTLNKELIESIRLMAKPTTTVVWITAPGTHSSEAPFRTLTVPRSGTRVLLFHLEA